MRHKGWYLPHALIYYYCDAPACRVDARLCRRLTPPPARRAAALPARHRDEVAAVFPRAELAGILVMPTCQRATVDLVRVGDEIEQEKDRLLERFLAFARAATDHLAAAGHWAEFIDPCSGLPMRDRSAAAGVYDEVGGLAALRGFATANAGCCKVVLHPRWGAAVYPATLFARAPAEAVVAAVVAAEAALAGTHGDGGGAGGDAA